METLIIKPSDKCPVQAAAEAVKLETEKRFLEEVRELRHKLANIETANEMYKFILIEKDKEINQLKSTILALTAANKEMQRQVRVIDLPEEL